MFADDVVRRREQMSERWPPQHPPTTTRVTDRVREIRLTVPDPLEAQRRDRSHTESGNPRRNGIFVQPHSIHALDANRSEARCGGNRSAPQVAALGWQQ
nr:hypothetical protein GCM10017611_70490 [Rhodococcus wratislaviensis]